MTDEDALIGEPLEEVPQREPDYHCNNRKSDDGMFAGYCQARAGAGTDHKGEGRCKWHGGAGGGPSGEANGAFKHGAYSEHLRSDLTEREEDAFDAGVDALEDEEGARELGRELAIEASIKYKRGQDPRFLREFRQLCSEFNLSPEDVRRHEHSGDLDVDHDHGLDEATREAFRLALRDRREDDP